MLSKIKSIYKRLPHPVRYIIISILGFSSLITGAVFMVLPGPGIPFIILGFAILATEFTWAEIALHKSKSKAKEMRDRIRKKKNNKKNENESK